MCMFSSPKVEKADGQYGELRFVSFPSSLFHERCLLIPALVSLAKGLYIRRVHLVSLIFLRRYHILLLWRSYHSRVRSVGFYRFLFYACRSFCSISYGAFFAARDAFT